MGSGISKMWVMLTPYKQVTWYNAYAMARNLLPIATDCRYHKSSLERLSMLKVGVWLDLMARNSIITAQGQKVKGQGHNVT